MPQTCKAMNAKSNASGMTDATSPHHLKALGCLEHLVLCIKTREHRITVVAIEVDELYERDVAAHELFLSGMEHAAEVSIERRRRLGELAEILAYDVEVGLPLLCQGEALPLRVDGGLVDGRLCLAYVAAVMVP